MATSADSRQISSGNVAKEQKEQIVAGLQTKSDKIRALHRAGCFRSEIANFLGIRYQHVRNVLVNDERVAGNAPLQPTRAGGGGNDVAVLQGKHDLDPHKIHIDPSGRVALPIAFLQELGLQVNAPVIVTLEDGAIRLMSLPAAVRRAQAIVRRHVAAGVSLVDELLTERRAEAERENGNG